MKEIRARLLFAERGPEYLTCPAPRAPSPAARASASGWRPRSARALMGVLYILDEPSIGLHQRDNDKLLATLKQLRDLGNTLIVVEHDEDTMRAADYLVDIGPGRGRPRRRGRGRRHAGGDLQAERSHGPVFPGSGHRRAGEARAGNGNVLTVHGAGEQPEEYRR